MTMTQKILAAAAGLESVEAGQLIEAKLNVILGNDITTPVAINEFNKAGFDSVCDPSTINIVLDHFVPAKDIKSAQMCKQCREFAHQYEIENFFDVGKSDKYRLTDFTFENISVRDEKKAFDPSLIDNCKTVNVNIQ